MELLGIRHRIYDNMNFLEFPNNFFVLKHGIGSINELGKFLFISSFDFIPVCTPIGFIRLFSLVGQVLVKPNLLRNVNEEFHAFNLEEASVKRKIAGNKNKGSSSYFRKS